MVHQNGKVSLVVEIMALKNKRQNIPTILRCNAIINFNKLDQLMSAVKLNY